MMQVFQDQYNLCSIEPGMRLTVKKAQNTVIIRKEYISHCHSKPTGGRGVGRGSGVRSNSSSGLLLKVYPSYIWCYLLLGNLGSL